MPKIFSINDDNLFSRKVHPGVIVDVYHNISARVNKEGYDVSEHVVQEFMYRYLKYKLNNTPYIAEQEKRGKFDCVIEQEGINYPAILYELKTYIKPHEKIRHPEIYEDLAKIAYYLSTNPETRGFFVLGAQTTKIVETIGTENALRFVGEHFGNNKKHIKITLGKGKYQNKFTHTPEIVIYVRPSIKKVYGPISVLSWEIVLRKGISGTLMIRYDIE